MTYASTDCDTAPGNETLITGRHEEVIGECGLNALERVLRNTPGFLNIEKMDRSTEAI
ncbi:hypothetical protein [Sphingopyxis sp. 550A]